jgi:hypothetical protein
MPAIDLTKLATALGDRCQDDSVKTDILTGLMYQPAFENRIEVLEGAVDEIPMPNAVFSDPLSPLKSAANVPYKDGLVEVDARKLKVKDCILATKIIPWNLYPTFLGQLRKDTLKGKEVQKDNFYMLFADFILEHIRKKAAEEFYMKTLFKGVRDDDGDSAEDLFDGYLAHIAELITDNDLTPVTTGAFSSSNTYEKLLQMYDAFGEAYKGGKVHFHAAPQIFDWMQRLMNPLTNISTFLPRSQQELMNEGLMNALQIPGTNAILFREPAMHGSGRVIATMPGNLFLGWYNKMDEAVFEVQKEDMTLKLFFAFKAGTQIGLATDDHGALIVNNQS